MNARKLIGLAGLCALIATPALAAHPLRVGVFLPTTMANGQNRFQVSQKLGVALQKALKTPVTALNFGRYEDFSHAVLRGRIDLAIVDAWAAVQLNRGTPVALGKIAGKTTQRWVIITARRGAVSSLAHHKVAVPRGIHALNAKLLTNVMFEGDFNALRFRLVPVPNVESALRLFASKGAAAALVPRMRAPKDAREIYRSRPLPGVVALRFTGNASREQRAVTSIPPITPFEGFVPADAHALDSLRHLLVRGPPTRQPVLAVSPIVRPAPKALVSFRKVGLTLPSFVDMIVEPKAQPDD